MKPLYLLLPFFLLVLHHSGLAQRDGSIRGHLKDTASHMPVPDATVTVLDLKDSSLVSFSRSGPSGSFLIKSLARGAYRLLVTHVGYLALSRNFVITEELRDPDLGELPLADKSKMLEEVTVSQEAPPVTVRHDTIEFNAGSFKTRPDAVVEDLLKKLPGIQVDKNGNIKSNGEQVKKVLVDGKEFFGNDPKIATKNLPAEVVDKVQVFDKKSEQSQFTGFDDGNSQKTINLTIKKDRKHGIFGSLTAGGGFDARTGQEAQHAVSEGRYEGKFNLNQFSGERQFSALGMTNNTSKQGFAFQDVMGFGGGMKGGGNGSIQIGGAGVPISEFAGNSKSITTSRGGGLNFNDRWQDRTDISGNYFYNGTDDRSDQKSARQYLAPGNSFTQDQVNISDRHNENHRLNFISDTRIDSFNSLRLTSSFTRQFSNSHTVTTDSSRQLGTGALLNTGASDTYGDTRGYSWNSTALLRHRMAKKGRTLSLNLSFGLDNSTGVGNLHAINTFYKGGSLATADTLDQRYDQPNRTARYGATLVYTEPLSRNSLLEFSYEGQQNRTQTDKNTFDADKNGKFVLPNESLTNSFNNTYTYHREGVAFRHQRKMFNFTLGANWQQTLSDNTFHYPGGDSSRHLSFQNILPNANFQYEFNKFQGLRLFYNTNTSQPDISQLQPLPDNSDPLNIRVGNPGLKQEYDHSLRLNYTSFDPFRHTSFFAMLNYMGIHHRIVNDDRIDSVGVRTSRFVNIDGLYRLNGNLSWGLPLRSIRSTLNLNSSLGYDHSAGLVNGARNNGNTWSLGQGADLSFTYKELLDITAGGRLDYNDTRYSLQPGQNQNYWTETYSLDANIYLPKGFSLASDLNYIHRSGLPAGYNSSPLVWNAGFAKQFLKSKKATLRLQVFDLLQQNTGFARNTSQNYIEDVSYRVLNRYWLLSFTYRLSRFAGKSVPGGGEVKGMNIRVLR